MPDLIQLWKDHSAYQPEIIKKNILENQALADLSTDDILAFIARAKKEELFTISHDSLKLHELVKMTYFIGALLQRCPENKQQLNSTALWNTLFEEAFENEHIEKNKKALVLSFIYITIQDPYFNNKNVFGLPTPIKSLQHDLQYFSALSIDTNFASVQDTLVKALATRAFVQDSELKRFYQLLSKKCEEATAAENHFSYTGDSTCGSFFQRKNSEVSFEGFKQTKQETPTRSDNEIHVIYQISPPTHFNVAKHLSRSTGLGLGLMAGVAVSVILMHFVLAPLTIPAAVTLLACTMLILGLCGLGLGQGICAEIDRHGQHYKLA